LVIHLFLIENKYVNFIPTFDCIRLKKPTLFATLSATLPTPTKRETQSNGRATPNCLRESPDNNGFQQPIEGKHIRTLATTQFGKALSYLKLLRTLGYDKLEIRSFTSRSPTVRTAFALPCQYRPNVRAATLSALRRKNAAEQSAIRHFTT